MPVKNPPHPGQAVRADCIERLGLTVTAAAKALDVSRQALNNLINGQAAMSPEMAIRLDKAFGGGAEKWLYLQVTYDLAQAEKHAGKIKVRRIAVLQPHLPDNDARVMKREQNTSWSKTQQLGHWQRLRSRRLRNRPMPSQK